MISRTGVESRQRIPLIWKQTYSRCISIIVDEDEDEDQIIAQKRASGEMRGFVDKSKGHIRLERILFPVAHNPSPISSLERLTNLLAPLGISSAAFQFIHVGDSEPQIVGLSGQPLSGIQVVQGPVEETILRI